MPQSLRDFRTMTSEIVKMNTARSLEDWFRIMDKFNATTKSRNRIQTYLRDCYSLGGWWLSAVVARYEYDKSIILKETG